MASLTACRSCRCSRRHCRVHVEAVPAKDLCHHLCFDLDCARGRNREPCEPYPKPCGPPGSWPRCRGLPALPEAQPWRYLCVLKSVLFWTSFPVDILCPCIQLLAQKAEMNPTWSRVFVRHIMYDHVLWQQSFMRRRLYARMLWMHFFALAGHLKLFSRCELQPVGRSGCVQRRRTAVFPPIRA